MTTHKQQHKSRKSKAILLVFIDFKVSKTVLLYKSLG